MPREPSITYEEAVAIIEQLRATGVKVTTRAIRDKAGKGSFGTINRLLRQYYDEQPVEPSLGDTIDSNIIRAINSYVATRVKEASVAASARMNDLRAEIDSLLSENELLTKKYEDQAALLVDLQETNATLVGRIDAMDAAKQASIMELAESRRAAQDALAEVAKSQVRIEMLLGTQAEAQALRTELSEANAKVAELHEKAAVAEAQLKGFIRGRKKTAVPTRNV